MTTRRHALSQFEGFLAEEAGSSGGLNERAFCLEAVGDHKFLNRLRTGAGITLSTIEKAEAFIASRRVRRANGAAGGA